MGAYINSISFDDQDFKLPPLRQSEDLGHTHALSFPSDSVPLKVQGTGPHRLVVGLSRDPRTRCALVFSLYDPYYQNAGRVVLPLLDVLGQIGSRPRKDCEKIVQGALSEWLAKDNPALVLVLADALGKSLKDMGFNIGLHGVSRTEGLAQGVAV